MTFLYPVGIRLPTGKALSNRIVIKSPSPSPGITFNNEDKALTVTPNTLDNPSYCVTPSV